MSESSRTPEENWAMREMQAISKPDANELFYSENEKRKRRNFISFHGVPMLLSITRFRFDQPTLPLIDIARRYGLPYDKVRLINKGLNRFNIGQAELEDLLKDQRFDSSGPVDEEEDKKDED